MTHDEAVKWLKELNTQVARGNVQAWWLIWSEALDYAIAELEKDTQHIQNATTIERELRKNW